MAYPIVRYGLKFSAGTNELEVERHMLRSGGQWIGKSGRNVGNGMLFHMRKFEELLWPGEKLFHRWNLEQLELYLHNRSLGVMGPASCVAGHTRILNPVTGESPTIKELCDSGTAPVVMTLNGPRQATVPFVKGYEDLYEFTMSDGSKFTCTAGHLLLGPTGFAHAIHSIVGSPLCGYAACHPQSTSECDQSVRVSGAEHWRKIVQDSQSDCRTCSCCDDEQPQPSAAAFQCAAPSPAYAQACMECACGGLGAPGREYKVQHVTVSSIRWAGKGVFYDLQVPVEHHYFAEGVIHHNSGKTNSAATDLLADWLIWPECTTVLISSTTLERLEDRIWGEIKKYFKLAKRRWPHIAGHLIEGKRRILFDGRSEASEGRDFRNGIIGVPTKRGENYVGLGDYIGIKNTRVRMAADELQLLPAIFIFAASNLDKNPDFKMVGLGNPKDTTDALGALCEPAFDLGGWDGNIDQTPETKTWKTRYGGVALQLVGTDSPNLDGKLGIPLITQEAIDRDIERYGRDSLQFTMMNQGMMPKGQGSRRIITRQICLRNHAMEEPVWLDSDRTKIAFMDAAYGGAGGDRCVYGELEFGREIAPLNLQEITPDLTTQAVNRNRHRQVIALTRTTLVPINVKLDVPAEEQIVTWVKSQCDTANIPPEHFIFDAGMRTVLVSKFGQLWSPAVVSVDFGGMPSDRPVGTGLVDKKGKIVTCREYYSKFVTELWYTVRLVIESGQFRGLTDGVMQEGCMREWTITGGNKIEVEPKDSMRDKTGRSPDLFDALCAGVELARRLGFAIELKEPLERRAKAASPAWKRQALEKSKKAWAEGALEG